MFDQFPDLGRASVALCPLVTALRINQRERIGEPVVEAPASSVYALAIVSASAYLVSLCVNGSTSGYIAIHLFYVMIGIGVTRIPKSTRRLITDDPNVVLQKITRLCIVLVPLLSLCAFGTLLCVNPSGIGERQARDVVMQAVSFAGFCAWSIPSRSNERPFLGVVVNIIEGPVLTISAALLVDLYDEPAMAGLYFIVFIIIIGLWVRSIQTTFRSIGNLRSAYKMLQRIQKAHQDLERRCASKACEKPSHRGRYRKDSDWARSYTEPHASKSILEDFEKSWEHEAEDLEPCWMSDRRQ